MYSVVRFADGKTMISWKNMQAEEESMKREEVASESHSVLKKCELHNHTDIYSSRMRSICAFVLIAKSIDAPRRNFSIPS